MGLTKFKFNEVEQEFAMAASSDLQIKLSGPEGVFYTPGSEIKGEIWLNLTVVQPHYKRITVTLIGKADVYFTVPVGNNYRQFRDSDTLIRLQTIAWETDRNLGRQLSTGQHVFPFSFILPSNERIPSSLEARDGKIRYTIEAKLIRGIDKEIEVAATYARILVQNRVDVNRSDLLAPRSVQKESTAGCFCIGRGLLSVTATIPRSGYCFGIDTIPVKVQVEPGLRQQVDSITVSLIQRVQCYTQEQLSVSHSVVSMETNVQMPRTGVSFTWNAPPLFIPNTADLTLTNCDIVRLGYFIRVEFTSKCMDAQHIDIPVIIGNVPFTGRDNGIETKGVYVPTLLPVEQDSRYQPPVIPTFNNNEDKPNGDDLVDDIPPDDHETKETNPLIP